MSSAREIAKRYLVEEYLTIEPDFLSFTEWLDDEEIDTPDDAVVHDVITTMLRELAQRLAEED